MLARGPKAAGALATLGLPAHWCAPGERSEQLVAHLGPELSGRRIAVQRDGAEQAFTAAALASSGADVVDIPVYRWEPPSDPEPARTLIAATLDERLDVVTFTSAAAVNNLFDLAGSDAERLAAALSGEVVSVCVGPVCNERLEAWGVGGSVHPERFRLGPMVRIISEALRVRSRRVRVGAVEAVVQGTVVVVDGVEARMTPRERRLLDVLLDARGAVVAKRQLVRAVWDAGTDPHVVEVTVGRLRGRLGPAAALIETVPRRGYRVNAG